MSSVRQKAAIFERHGQANGSLSPHAQYNGSITEGGHEQAETTAPNTGDGYMSKAEMRKRGISRHSITSGDDADVYPPKAPLNKNVSWSSRPHPNAVQGSGIAALEEKLSRLIKMVDYQENEMKSLKKKNKILNDRINELEGNPSGDAEETRKKAITRAASLHDEAQKISYDEAYKAVSNGLNKEYIAKCTGVSNLVNRKVININLKKAIADLLPSDFKMRKGFSTMLVSQRFVSSIDELFEDAVRVLPTFEKKMKEIAEKCGNSCELSIGPLKSKKRAAMKALFKYSDKEDGGIAWYRLTDIIRATIMFDDMEQMYRGLEEVVKILTTSNIREFNDRYVQPMAGNYRDLQLLIAVDEHVCELQLNTKKMMTAKNTTGHRDFEVVRELIAAVAEGDQSRVLSALEFGRIHLADKEKGLESLLRSPNLTVMHDAARLGHADILASFLKNGASLNAQHPKTGKTPLHYAVGNGHERCVWAILSPPKWASEEDLNLVPESSSSSRRGSRRASQLNIESARLDIRDNEERTALVEGYIMMWTKPSESARRAVTTLACFAGQQTNGADIVNEAKKEADIEIRKMWKQSSQLVTNAADGNVDRVRAELLEFSGPNSISGRGPKSPAISVAAECGHLDIVKLLLEFKADLLLKDEGRGYSVVDHAVLGKKPEIVRQVTCYLVDIIEERMFKPSLCATDSSSKQEAELKKLWREHIKTDVNDWCKGGDLRNCEEFEITYMGKGKGKGKRNRDELLKRVGFTPKDFAAGGLSIKDAKFDCADCKSVGVDVNECLKGGYTATEIKAGKYSPKEFALAGDPVTKLKEAGFSVEGCIKDGIKLAMCQAAGWSKKELLDGGFSSEDFKRGEEADKALKKLDAEMCAGGEKYDDEKLKTALSWRGEHQTNGECTRLHIAAYEGKVEEAKWLIQKGALVEALNTANRTPIHWAARQGQLEIVNMLIDVGCKIDIKSECDYTPFITAAWQGHPGVTELLIQKGANMTAVSTPDGYTALHWALFESKDNLNSPHMECAKLCIAEENSGSPLEVQCTENGQTPLHMCCGQMGFKVCVEFLLSHPEFKKRAAKLLATKNKGGRIPYEEAKKFGQTECCVLIKAAEDAL
ncbi:hypothetical protein TrVE_jg13274 [Triparma verrucosa]|uniref:Uncharacterized protein n=1 Tax=Triparma verrucosa TaxID=1606542 RepID=A0A9W7F8E9_9STRA|nr:hypothetical protein TrVE_jg13274 [Triparma verrucosa]